MKLDRRQLIGAIGGAAAALEIAQGAGSAVQLEIDFSRKLQPWDGFGVNYVEVSQTRDYKAKPQEYGGFSILKEAQRREILDMVFGEDGLRPGLLKMFLDPWHQGEDRKFDHETTTKWLRYFAREGLARTRARGGDLDIITTLYGPPAWMTKQKFMRGRDLDPARKRDCAQYMIDWVKYLREQEKLPVKYISLHNEGEDFSRWPVDARDGGAASHDYNLFWPPWQVVDFLKFMRPMLDSQGLKDVGITPGEATNWYRFVMWGHATAIAADPDAVRNLGLITSHGFTGKDAWYGDHNPRGNDLLRLQRPELHSWTTSMTWGKMDIEFVDDLRRQVYDVKVNGAIPWAAIQTNTWTGGDPNPGTAFRVDVEKGAYTVEPAYWLYKQVTRAGQPGTVVATVKSSDPAVRLMAFAAGGKHPDAFVAINTAGEAKPAEIRATGGKAQRFRAFRTSGSEKCAAAGEHAVAGGVIRYDLPARSVTTFIGS